MKQFVPMVLAGALATIAASSLAQTATKPPQKPVAAAKPVATAPGAKSAVHATAARHAAARPLARHPVFVPPPPVIELDEMSPPDLPTVLSNEERDRYRRIFQAQAGGQWADADAEIAKLGDKVLMGYVGAQRLLSQGYPARYDQLAAWLQEYNERRPHQGRWCYGKTPMQTFVDSVPLAKQKILAA